MLRPQLLRWKQWNAETCGDIVEALLGLQYLRRESDEYKKIQFPTGFARFLHEWCYSIYRYFAETAWAHTDMDTLRHLFFSG